MAGWDCDYNNDDDVLNLNLFARKSFGFYGIPKEKEDILRKIATHIGACCDDEYPKYIFTSVEHYNSLTDISTPLYNVTYIRDSVDANRCLTIEHYKFGPKYSEKKDYREFDPCCANFHNGNEACLVCDPKFGIEVTVVKKKSRNKSTPISEVSTAKIKKEQVEEKLPEVNEDSNSAALDTSLRKSAWEPWEDRMLLDYMICNKLIPFAKSCKLYRKMTSEGYLKHRTAESARIHFRLKILKRIESYDLPPAVLKEFKKLKKMQHPGHEAIKKHKQKKRKVIKNTIKQSAKES